MAMLEKRIFCKDGRALFSYYRSCEQGIEIFYSAEAEKRVAASQKTTRLNKDFGQRISSITTKSSNRTRSKTGARQDILVAQCAWSTLSGVPPNVFLIVFSEANDVHLVSCSSADNSKW
jgi:hypothetical protein